MSDLNECDSRRLQHLREQLPEALLVATTEEPHEPIRSLLRSGADQVVGSPYNPHELVLRCESLHAFAGNSAPQEGLRVADLDVQLSRYHATKNEQPLSMTALELRLLHCLCEHFPLLAPMDRLLAFAWDSEEVDAHLIKTHMTHIRRKLERAGGTPLHIVSKPGAGYMLLAG